MSSNTRILGAPQGAGTVSSGPSVVDCLPDSIPGYHVLKAIGQGGMGNVYEVRHETLDKCFALKLISESLRDNAEALERFRCETLALGKLEHPNIVLAVDAGVWQGRPFLVTELLKGQDLASRVTATGKLAVEQVISIATQVADALSFAHEHGYFHRDIKPSNIFLQPDGKAKLLDFGLVRSESNHSRTQAGCLMGTVDFVAPEQACNAAQARAASDIYSLGCTLIFLLSGHVPFPDSRYPSLAAKIHAHLNETPEWLNRAKNECPSWLFDLIHTMVAKSPKDRPANCQLVYDSLQSRTFPLSGPAANYQTRTYPASLSTSLKLTVGSGIAVMVAGLAWTANCITNAPTITDPEPKPAPVSSISESMAPPQPNDAAQVTQIRQQDSAIPTHSEEKTLPVSVTHNARGARLPGKELGKSFTEPSVFLSQDAGHE